MMELDTAADFSIMSKSEYLEKFADEPLTPSQVTLKTYTGEVLNVSGEMHCDIVYKGKQYCLPILVANYDAKPTLLGKNWLRHIKIEWGEIFCSSKGDVLSADSQLNDLLSKHSELFTESYEGMKGLEAHITMRNDARPTFVKARRVPYALKEQVERELDKLEKNGVIKKTDRSCWASPVVVVPKADGTVRICGDYKSTINQSVEDEQYVLPTTQDLYTALVGSKVFSKLDLSHAYAQLNVDKESQEYLTIATHKGLYSYLKLPYGVKSSPKIFQAKMDQIVTATKKFDHITPVLIQLHWLPVHFRILFKVYKALNGMAPLYITELLSYRTCSRTLRSTDQKLLAVPKSRLKTYGDRAFSVAAPKLWNELPLDLRSLDTINLFKKHLKTDLFKKAFNV